MRLNLGASRFFTALLYAMCPALPRVRFHFATAFFAFAIITCSANISFADEDGTSFWIPGFFGSLAAVPQQPGWSLTSIFYNTNVSASGNAAVAREITIGQFPKFPISITGSANVHAHATIGFVAPSYVYATPFLGGQASASFLFGYGNNDTSLNATGTATALLPTPISITRSISLQQDTSGFTDLIPFFVDRWNAGVNNYIGLSDRRHSSRPVQLQQSGEYRPRPRRHRRWRRLHLFQSEDRP